MTVVVRAIAGVLLLAHGLVHLLYLAPDVDAFSLESGPVPEAVRRPVAAVPMTATGLAFALVALSVWGLPGLSEAWPALTLVAAGAAPRWDGVTRTASSWSSVTGWVPQGCSATAPR